MAMVQSLTEDQKRDLREANRTLRGYLAAHKPTIWTPELERDLKALEEAAR